MQERPDRPDYPTVDDPSIASTLSSGGNAGTAVSTLDPYIPPNVPHGLPHVVRFATLSSMDLPLEVRFLIIMLARFANVDGVASVAVSTLCEICRIGSKNTVERWIGLAADVGILRKEPGKGGKDRKSNSYTFLGASRDWAPLPVGRPDTNPIVALAQARRLIEELQPRAARVDDLEAELVLLEAEMALLRNGSANGHPEVTSGESEPRAAPPSDSYETALPEDSRASHGAIGHPEMTNGSVESPHDENPHSHEAPYSEPSSATQEATGHSKVTDGSDEGQEYLSRRGRVEALVMEHRSYYDRRFRGGVLSAIHHFSLNAENEDDLIRQVNVLRAGQEPGSSGAGAAQGAERPPPREETLTEAGCREVEYCPDCSSPYTTFNGADRCPDCTDRRRRESEA